MSTEIRIPDIGTDGQVTVIEIAVKSGDVIAPEQTLVTLESEKATMEIPSPESGTVESIALKIGDKVKAGDVILKLKNDAANTKKPEAAEVNSEKSEKSQKPEITKNNALENSSSENKKSNLENNSPENKTKNQTSPSVRRLARELNIDLNNVTGTGRNNRLQKVDLLNHIKSAMQSGGTKSGSGLPVAPSVNFSQFGEIETQPLSKIKKLSGTNLHRNWVLIPHITQFNDADITEMELFRKKQQERIDKEALGSIKLTPLVFIMKAIVAALKKFPMFNASLDSAGENLILKKYFHIGIAVDTPEGLVVPVIRDVDKKSLTELAQELMTVSQKARAKQLLPKDMQGSSFTISSLGGIGGTGFTPIVNMPDVAILGVSKAQIKPVYQDGEFVPRLMLPLSLSYDHRVIDGAEGARFIVQLSQYLTDFRLVLM